MLPSSQNPSVFSPIPAPRGGKNNTILYKTSFFHPRSLCLPHDRHGLCGARRSLLFSLFVAIFSIRSHVKPVLSPHFLPTSHRYIFIQSVAQSPVLISVHASSRSFVNPFGFSRLFSLCTLCLAAIFFMLPPPPSFGMSKIVAHDSRRSPLLYIRADCPFAFAFLFIVHSFRVSC